MVYYSQMWPLWWSELGLFERDHELPLPFSFNFKLVWFVLQSIFVFSFFFLLSLELICLFVCFCFVFPKNNKISSWFFLFSATMQPTLTFYFTTNLSFISCSTSKFTSHPPFNSCKKPTQVSLKVRRPYVFLPWLWFVFLFSSFYCMYCNFFGSQHQVWMWVRSPRWALILGKGS